MIVNAHAQVIATPTKTASASSIAARTLLSGAEAESRIQAVGDARSKLNDAVASTLDPGSRLRPIVDPNWKVEDYRVPEGRIISLRHPGLGWLTFILSEDSASEMVRQLTADVPVRT